MKKLYLLLGFVWLNSIAFGQLIVNQTFTPQQLVQNTLIGYGVTVSNITYTGAPVAIGKFTNGGTTNIGLLSGIVMTSGLATNAIGPNISGSITGSNNTGSDPQLAALVTSTVNDAAVLEFDFVPIADTLKFRYVFGSDEYAEYVNSQFNDIFGFFISGPNPQGGNYLNHNMAIIPNTLNTSVSINNVNNGTTNSGPCTNCTYYVNNSTGLTIEYDGLTTVLTAFALVEPCSTYHFKAAIGDVGDASLDSGVFLEANSFISTAVQISTSFSVTGAFPKAIEGCNDAVIKATLPKILNYPFYIPIDSMWGTAINGTDFPFINDTIIVPAGVKSVNVTLSPIADHIPEPTENYNFVIKTSVCTIDTIMVDIFDYEPITLTTSPDTMVCSDTAFLRAQINNGMAPLHYQWQPTNVVTSPNSGNTTAFPAQTTPFIITATDTTGCPAVVDTVIVTVSQKPTVSFLPDIFQGCEPLTVNFQDMSFPNIAQWLWDFGDGTQSTVQNPTHTFSAGNYGISLSVETNQGCTGSFSVPNLIKAWPTPKAFFEAKPPVTTIENPLISFTDLSQNGQNYLWDFGDPNSADNTSGLTNPSHTYSSDGVYMVWLILTTDKGCIDSVSREVMVIIDEIEIPNIITPNSDGYNDVFYIKNIDKLEWSHIKIYNRWGKIVYESENYKNDWDGRNVADGVYHFVLYYRTYFREDKEEGMITVLRKK